MKKLAYLGLVLRPEYGAEEHQAYRVAFTRKLLDRIAHLSGELAWLKAFSIAVLDSSLEVYSRWPANMPDAILHGDCEPDEPAPGNTFDPEKHRVQADFAMITIYPKGDFAWSWHPGEGDGRQRCHTEMFNLDAVLRDWKKRVGGRRASAA